MFRILKSGLILRGRGCVKTEYSLTAVLLTLVILIGLALRVNLSRILQN